jgi:four helix bundle protein
LQDIGLLAVTESQCTEDEDDDEHEDDSKFRNLGLNWPMVSPAVFDHEKLDVYQLELKFLIWVTQFLAEMSCPSPTQTRELREQLDRASLSALLNTAEGNGRRQGRQRAKFFDDARGSAIECAACLDASVAKGFTAFERIQPGKQMLIRIVAMLCKLVERFDPEQYRVRENASGVAQQFEGGEDEHESGTEPN